MSAGREWIVDAHGCRPERLRDRPALVALLDRVVGELELHVVSRSVHPFPAPGGITALYLLSESHLACHTYPETGLATFNLYCCRPRPAWPWAERLVELLGATRVEIRDVPRGGAR
jgi:S-adenosylmethionine decarboxylase